MERLTHKNYSFCEKVECECCESRDCYEKELYTRLKSYEDAEEQGMVLRLPYKVSDVIDVLFSHNEKVSLWIELKEEITYHQLIWSGMAWNLPEELKLCDFVKVFGTIPDKITQADIINIEVTLSEEAE